MHLARESYKTECAGRTTREARGPDRNSRGNEDGAHSLCTLRRVGTYIIIGFSHFKWT